MYTYHDETGSIIDLTNYNPFFLEVKLQGQVYTIAAASVVGSPTSGVVQSALFLVAGIGVWTVQFFAVDAFSNKLPGELLIFTVVPNVDDLALTQLPNY